MDFLAAPNLGTPSAGILTNCNGLPVTGTTFSATSRLAGRGSSGSGAGEEIVVGTGLTISGTTLSTTSSGGTVTSVAISGPSVFSWSGTPITSSGTLTGTLANQNANIVLAGPSSGGASTPAFRALVNADIPASTLIPTNAYASLSASQAGLINFPNNGVAVYRDTGSVLSPWGPIFPLTAFVDSGFSWNNQGSSTISTALGRTIYTIPASATSNLRSYIKSKTAPYTITMAFMPCFQSATTAGSAGGRGGLCFTDDTKFHTFWFEFNSTAHGSGIIISSYKWTNSTTFSATYQTRCFAVRSPLIWLQISDDNSNRLCKISVDGQNWITFHSVTRTDFLTATKAGLSLEDGNSNIGQHMIITHWVES